MDAVEEALSESNELLKDEELLQLHESTNFDNNFENQRYNVVLFAFRTGLRKHSLQWLRMNMIKEERNDDGTVALRIHVPDMKNAPTGFDALDKHIFKQKNLSIETRGVLLLYSVELLLILPQGVCC